MQVTHCSCHSCELSAHGPELGRQSFGFKPAILHAWWVFLGIFWLSALLEAEGDHEELLVFYYGFNTLFAGEDVASGCGMCVCVCVIFWQAPGPRSEIEMPTANLPNYFLVDSALGKSCPSYSAQDEPIIRLSCTDARGNRKKAS